MATPTKSARRHVTILSLGAGIQSTALAIMLEQGMLPEYPMPEWAIFADTHAETPNVYDTLDWLQPLVSFPIIRTSWGDLATNTWKALRGQPVPERGHQGKSLGYIDLPVFTGKGLARRQCTTIYKVTPVRNQVKELTGMKPPALTMTQYLGISINESKRAKPAREQWITNQYPLVEEGWTRQMLKSFLDETFPGHPVRRSACWFCPFHTTAEWQEIRELYPDLYEQALNMEKAMADHPRGPWYLKNGGLEASMKKLDMQPALDLPANSTRCHQ